MGGNSEFRSLYATLPHLNQVDFAERLEVGRPYDVKYGYDILMVEMPEELNLAQSAETEHRVVKRGDPLDGYASLGRKVDGRAVRRVRVM